MSIIIKISVQDLLRNKPSCKTYVDYLEKTVVKTRKTKLSVHFSTKFNMKIGD